MWRTRTAGLIQIAGGLIGFGILFSGTELSSRPVGSVFLAVIVFSLCVLGGALLLRPWPFGRPLSVALQLAQIPHVVIAGWGIQFYAGLLVGIAFFNTTDASVLVTGLGAGFLLHTGQLPNFHQLGFNVAPLAVLLLLIPTRDRRAHAA